MTALATRCISMVNYFVSESRLYRQSDEITDSFWLEGVEMSEWPT